MGDDRPPGWGGLNPSWPWTGPVQPRCGPRSPAGETATRGQTQGGAVAQSHRGGAPGPCVPVVGAGGRLANLGADLAHSGGLPCCYGINGSLADARGSKTRFHKVLNIRPPVAHPARVENSANSAVLHQQMPRLRQKQIPVNPPVRRHLRPARPSGQENRSGGAREGELHESNSGDVKPGCLQRSWLAR